ncbi:MAG: PP2C family protein-serine/threonine phosphatase [Thermoanaerobaculia bacterium]
MTRTSVEAEIGALSDPGKVRPNNEDHYLVSRFQRTMTTVLTNLPEGTVPSESVDTVYGMLVADGMGGAAAGEVASRTTISTLVELALATPDWIMRLGDTPAETVLDRMQQRFQKLGEALLDRARADPKLSGMGTTLTLVLTLGPDLILAHIGDSRAYLFRHGQLVHLTRDQTVAQSLADAGAILPEDVARHPMRHMLTSAITTKGKPISAELHHLRLENGDQTLLCSDGLTDMVTDAGIAELLGGPGSAADVCRALVDRALAAGGKDNVTVVLGRYRISAD